MALGRKFQGCKTLSIHPAQSFQWGNRLREVQWGAWSHPAGHSWPSLDHSEVTLLLCSPLRRVVKFFSFPLEGCIPMEESQRDLSGRTSACLSPSYVYALDTEPFGFGLAQKSKFQRLDRWDGTIIFVMVQVSGQRSQDLDLNLLGQYRREDAFLLAIGPHV